MDVCRCFIQVVLKVLVSRSDYALICIIYFCNTVTYTKVERSEFNHFAEKNVKGGCWWGC